MKVSVTKRRSAAAGPPPPTTTTAASTRPSKSSAAAATCSRRDKQASIDDDLPQQQRTQLHPPPKQPVPATAVVLPPPPPPTKSTVSKTVAVSSLAAIREKYGIGPPGTSVDEIYEKRLDSVNFPFLHQSLISQSTIDHAPFSSETSNPYTQELLQI